MLTYIRSGKWFLLFIFLSSLFFISTFFVFAQDRHNDCSDGKMAQGMIQNSTTTQLQLVVCHNFFDTMGNGVSKDAVEIDAIWAIRPSDNTIRPYKIGDTNGRMNIWRSVDTPRGFVLLSGSSNCDPLDTCGWREEDHHGWPKEEVNPTYKMIIYDTFHNYFLYTTTTKENPQNFYTDCNDLDYFGVALFSYDNCKGEYEGYNQPINTVHPAWLIPDSILVASGWSVLVGDGTGNYRCLDHSHFNLDADYYPHTNEMLQGSVLVLYITQDSTCGGLDQNHDGEIDSPAGGSTPTPTSPGGGVTPTSVPQSCTNIGQFDKTWAYLWSDYNCTGDISWFSQYDSNGPGRSRQKSAFVPSGKVLLISSDNDNNGDKGCLRSSVQNLADIGWQDRIEWAQLADNCPAPTATPQPPPTATQNPCYTPGFVYLNYPSNNQVFFTDSATASVSFGWSSTNNTMYQFQIAKDSQFNTKPYDYHPSLTYTQELLEIGTYYWRVRAQDITAVCNVNGVWSEARTFQVIYNGPTNTPTSTATPTASPTPQFTATKTPTPTATQQPVDSRIPAAPENLRRFNEFEDHVFLLWDDMSTAETGFRIYSQAVDGQVWKLAATVAANQNSLNLPVSCGNTSRYQVTAFNQYGESVAKGSIVASTSACTGVPPTATATVTPQVGSTPIPTHTSTPVATPTIPNPPSNLTSSFTTVKNQDYTITWSSVSNTSSYRIKLFHVDTPQSTWYLDVVDGTASYTGSETFLGKYEWQVMAFLRDGRKTGWSEVATFNVVDPETQNPLNTVFLPLVMR